MFFGISSGQNHSRASDSPSFIISVPLKILCGVGGYDNIPFVAVFRFAKVILAGIHTEQ